MCVFLSFRRTFERGSLFLSLPLQGPLLFFPHALFFFLPGSLWEGLKQQCLCWLIGPNLLSFIFAIDLGMYWIAVQHVGSNQAQRRLHMHIHIYICIHIYIYICFFFGGGGKFEDFAKSVFFWGGGGKFEDFAKSARGGRSGLEKALVVVILRLPFPPRRLLLQLLLFLLFKIFLSVLTFRSFSFIYSFLWSVLLILFLVVSILFFSVFPSPLSVPSVPERLRN